MGERVCVKFGVLKAESMNIQCTGRFCQKVYIQNCNHFRITLLIMCSKNDVQLLCSKTNFQTFFSFLSSSPKLNKRKLTLISIILKWKPIMKMCNIM